MPKGTEENDEKLKEKLNYLGLDLEKIPKVLKEFKPFSFRPSKSYDEISYKVYQYIPITDIQILLTPTDRLTDLNQKYKLSAPISAYLDSKSESNLEKFATFLVMLNDMNIDNIENIEKEQEKIKKLLPYKVKYPNNYIWQIYYSDISNQYFMLVPTNETNNDAFFYLLKKQIECSKSQKKEMIFAPITHQEYSGNYLFQNQITDLENYLWYFTKEWPNIFEVYDSKRQICLKIIGKTKVYGDIQSDYVITLNTKEEALEWYKLVKALFILTTGLPDNYTFNTHISNKGELEFWYDDKTKIKYNNLTTFIKKQVKEKRGLILSQDKKIEEEKEILQNLKKITEKQTEEFLNKQKQIATFLACKKSFFGKIKYYFGNRKKHLNNIENYKVKNKKTNKKEEAKQDIPIEEEKENYTIEDLIEVCTKLDEKVKNIKNIEMDKKALELKQINLERKIKNANIYLNEIELHKKSIFEFWKFTNKDELPSLNEGEEESTSKEKIEKSFVYEEDIEDLGKKMDEVQRRKLSKNELDSIFAVKQVIASSQILNKTKSKDLTEQEKTKLQKQLDELKAEYKENIELIQIKDFDIFGGISEDQTKVKMLHNQKHREVEKDKFKILNITPNTDLDVFIDNLRNCIKLAKEALAKINVPFEMPVYISKIVNESEISGELLEKDNLNIANLNATQEIYKIANDIKQNQTLDFYTLILPKDFQAIYYTNITQFDNFNQTLPLGMDVSTEVLIDLKKYKLEDKEEKEFRINYQIDEYTNKVIKVHAVKYKVIYKTDKVENKTRENL